MVAQTLHRLYPPQDAEQLPLVLESFKLLRGIIRDADCRTVMDVLDALQPGVFTWIEDEDEILPDEEYNKTVSTRRFLLLCVRRLISSLAALLR